MNTILRSALAILLAGVAVAPPVSAFDYPLSSEAIREAYFLGSGDGDKRALFFDKYAKHYPIAKSGPYVASIRFETPYYIIAERVSQAFTNYHAPDAEQEFLGKPAICRIRAEIYYGISNIPTARYQTNYTIQLKQRDKEISIKRTWTEGMVSTDGSGPTIPGEYLTAEFNAGDIQSGTATVEMVLPDGKTLSEDFDLDGLR